MEMPYSTQWEYPITSFRDFYLLRVGGIRYRELKLGQLVASNLSCKYMYCIHDKVE